MKRICMIVPSFTAKGGITSVVSGYRGSELEKKYQIRYIETYCDGGKLKKLWKAICAYFLFLWTLVVFRPDLIHIHSSFGASFYRKMPFIWTGAMLKIPVVNHVHGAQWDSFYLNATQKSKAIKKSVLKKCQCIIALSEEWKKNLAEAVDPENIAVVVNYGMMPRDGEAAVGKTSNQVLFLGFLSQRKGCFDIPEIAALVQKQVDNVTFVLAGSGSREDVQYIHDLAEKHESKDFIQFPGWMRGAEKDMLLKNSALFFLPSYAEGMPMSVLEAMSHGLPVVSTTVGGIPQLVKQGETGFLCEPGDIKGFAEAITAILKDPQKQKEMGMAGLVYVQENYSLLKHINGVSAVYEKLMR